MTAIGTKPRCESSTGRSGAEDKADAQARTHHPFVRRRLNHAQALDNFRLSPGQNDFAARDPVVHRAMTEVGQLLSPGAVGSTARTCRRMGVLPIRPDIFPGAGWPLGDRDIRRPCRQSPLRYATVRIVRIAG